jgi:thiamine biosynthesis lipoprotein
MKSVLSEVRRARPLLGTFVEITAQGVDEARLHRAIDEAFSAVCTVHRLMSFHDATSDISQLNSRAMHKPVRVHQWTRRVLSAARNFSRETEGAWDITVAPLLRGGRFLADKCEGRKRGDWRDIILGRDGRVHFRRPLLIDVGGIAKGFAVDRATEALRSLGVRSGLVNAGGDLRVFGPEPFTARIRNPLDLAHGARTIVLRERSLATSVICNSSADLSNQSPLVDGRTLRSVSGNLSASVIADDCMTADALTKAVLLMRHEARSLLRRHQASAMLLSGDSSLCESVGGYEVKRHQA